MKSNWNKLRLCEVKRLFSCVDASDLPREDDVSHAVEKSRDITVSTSAKIQVPEYVHAAVPPSSSFWWEGHMMASYHNNASRSREVSSSASASPTAWPHLKIFSGDRRGTKSPDCFVPNLSLPCHNIGLFHTHAHTHTPLHCLLFNLPSMACFITLFYVLFNLMFAYFTSGIAKYTKRAVWYQNQFTILRLNAQLKEQ